MSRSTAARSFLWFEGTWSFLHAVAFTLALLQRFSRSGSPGGLTLLPFTGGLETDLLISAGMVERIRGDVFHEFAGNF